MQRPGSILFDLDGTLVDTAPDMAAALNFLLLEERLEAIAYERIRPQVSNGARGLLRLGFGVDDQHPDYERLRLRFLSLYESNLSVNSRLFEGMEQVLSHLEQYDIPWGVVTNKPGWLTSPLLAALNLLDRARCVVSGDTCEKAKPHPMPLLYAAELLGQAAAACLYVGDALRDVEAARAAGMPVFVAAYGYLETGSEPAQWGADALLQHPRDLLKIAQL
jgi:phosphoglycolate phosphatase